MRKFKTWALNVAEAFDSWRIVPRAMLVSYGYLVWSMYVWYRSIPLYPQIKCDSAVLEVVLSHGVKLAQAAEIACGYVGTVGGPTSEQTMFVTTITGLSAGIFALYTTTGRKWQKETGVVPKE